MNIYLNFQDGFFTVRKCQSCTYCNLGRLKTTAGVEWVKCYHLIMITLTCYHDRVIMLQYHDSVFMLSRQGHHFVMITLYCNVILKLHPLPYFLRRIFCNSESHLSFAGYRYTIRNFFNFLYHLN
jgi:hypothetical protein